MRMLQTFGRVVGMAGSIFLAVCGASVGGCAGGGEPLPPGTPSLPDAAMTADASLDGMMNVPDASATSCGHDERVESGACVACAPGSSNAPGDELMGPNTVCDPVGCPAGSSGDDLVSGCSCAAGYNGMVLAAPMSPYYTGSCEGVPCPEGTSGVDIPSGCMCDAGTVGEITPFTEAPFYTGGCEMLLCMADERVSMNACVACDPGTSNESGDDASGMDTTCDAVPCPTNSSGVDVASGCTCNDGFAGTIMPTAMAPYYSGVCISATVTFTYTGSTQTYTVPDGITRLRLEVSGSAGGNGSSTGSGGAGAAVAGTFDVTAGQELTVYAGGGQAVSQRGGDCSYVAMGVVAMAVAAGGGAGGYSRAGQPGAITESGTAPLISGSGVNGTPGSAGAGGGAGSGTWGTGGGGGWNSSGGTGSGSAGGAIRCMGSVGTTYAGGAGGGYSGGGGAAMASGWGTRGGGSGGSFNSGTSPVNTAGANTGLGAVSITAM